MVETATTTTITRTTTQVPAGSGTVTPTPAPSTATPTAAQVAAQAQRNDETTRAIFNLKIIVFVLLLPLILFAVLLKHLLDYLFALGLKEKDVSGKVALVSNHLTDVSERYKHFCGDTAAKRNATSRTFLFQ